ncbi:MAG: hypothetical protein MHMPM18_002841, partial [Marteilia pararefringens]
LKNPLESAAQSALKFKKVTALSVFQKEYYKNTKFGHIGDGSSKWKQLDAYEKQKYERMAEKTNQENIQRILPEIVENFKNGSFKMRSMAKQLLIKHFNYPKAPINPYLLFCKDLKSKNPDTKYFTPENKLHWEQLSEAEKNAYAEEFKELVKNHRRETALALRKIESLL